MRETPVVLLSGGDLQRLLRPETTIKALREAYSALAGNRGDQGRSVGFTVEGGSGSGVQDAAAAWTAYQEAVRLGAGLRCDLSGDATGA